MLRRLELRGQVRGGRFVGQVSGEQFGLADTVEELRRVKNRPAAAGFVSISAADPLNLLGVLLPGNRLARVTGNRVVFRDGLPLAVLEGKEVKFVREIAAEEKWPAQKALLRRGPLARPRLVS